MKEDAAEAISILRDGDKIILDDYAYDQTDDRVLIPVKDQQIAILKLSNRIVDVVPISHSFETKVNRRDTKLKKRRRSKSSAVEHNVSGEPIPMIWQNILVGLVIVFIALGIFGYVRHGALIGLGIFIFTFGLMVTLDNFKQEQQKTEVLSYIQLMVGLAALWGSISIIVNNAVFRNDVLSTYFNSELQSLLFQIWAGFGIIVVLMGVPLFMIQFASLAQLKEAIESYRWPVVPGKIIASEYTTHEIGDSDGTSTHYLVRLVYEVTIEGETIYRDDLYLGEFYFSSPGLYGRKGKQLSSEWRAKRMVKKYPLNKIVDVYYQRTDDKIQTILHPGIRLNHILKLLFPVTIIIVGIGLMGYIPRIL